MDKEPHERTREPTDALRRRIYRMSFRKQILLFIVLGLVAAFLLVIYAIVVSQFLFGSEPLPTPAP